MENPIYLIISVVILIIGGAVSLFAHNIAFLLIGWALLGCVVTGVEIVAYLFDGFFYGGW